jgi:predicted transcriptional regulator
MPVDKRLADVGNFIRQQRELAQHSIRDLAKLAGVSNPYLSQIERGLRKPSADILQSRCTNEQEYSTRAVSQSRQSQTPSLPMNA